MLLMCGGYKLQHTHRVKNSIICSVDAVAERFVKVISIATVATDRWSDNGCGYRGSTFGNACVLIVDFALKAALCQCICN